eukprot:m.68628 g.68628  ORF g.68628 m.68628 type:complete len:154 (+) comp7509_c0_seq2:1178-1639(+)
MRLHGRCSWSSATTHSRGACPDGLLSAYVRYNRLFRFLLYTKSVQMALNDMWLSMTHRKDTATMASLSALASLRARMSFFVNHFQDYLQADVLEAEFDALQARIRSVTDIRVLAAAHDEYLTALETKTMLGQPKAIDCVTSSYDQCFACASYC